MSQSNGNEITIAVMGPTGTGKTSFINLVSGSTFAVGAGLNSCTPAIQKTTPFPLSGRQVVLIDTPGFYDTAKTDTDILKLISEYLASTYRDGKKLSGIIFMHRISDVRLGGIALRNFHMFRSLCGDSTLKNVAIVTNMWGTVDGATAAARERELSVDPALFQPALSKGARMLRHTDTPESARAILQHLVGNTPEALQVQAELVDQRRMLAETAAAAAAALSREIQEKMRVHEQERREAQTQVTAALAAAEERRKREAERVRREVAAEAERARVAHERMRVQQEAERREAAARALAVQRAIDAQAAAAREQQANAERLRIVAQQQAAAAVTEQEKLRQQVLRLYFTLGVGVDADAFAMLVTRDNR